MSDKSSAAGSLSCCGYSCEQSFSMDLSSKPQPSSSWGFSLRSGLQGGFWDKIRGAIEGSVSPVGSAEGERPEIVSAQRSVGPAPRGPQAYWANGRGGKRKPFSGQSENGTDKAKRVVVPPLRSLNIGIFMHRTDSAARL